MLAETHPLRDYLAGEYGSDGLLQDHIFGSCDSDVHGNHGFLLSHLKLGDPTPFCVAWIRSAFLFGLVATVSVCDLFSNRL